uniref:SH2 domain-containing protein n=1 Tax=Panagrolaimus sp. PS1159 TaxID=55785 RepID=A0AC35GSM8_9BILA
MDRFKASKLLKNDGDFLIRLGKSMDDLLYKPVLSVKWRQRNYHFLIKEFNSLFWIEKSQFGSIASLIRYYLNTKKPVTQNSGVILGNAILSKKFNTSIAKSQKEKRGREETTDLTQLPSESHIGGVLEASRSFSYALLGENAPYILQNLGKIAAICALIIFLYICTVF